MKKHPGFKSAARSIARKEGISPDRARAILASSTRKASPAAKKANPSLKKVPAAKPNGRSSRIERAVNSARARMKGVI